MTIDIFKTGMKKLCVFFDKPLKAGQLRIWYDILKHIPDKAFQSAVSYIVRTNKFFPTPEDFMVFYREFHPREWKDVKREYGLPDFTPKELKDKVAKRDKIVNKFLENKDMNRIIGDKK